MDYIVCCACVNLNNITLYNNGTYRTTFVKMSANVIIPTRATGGSVGLDFYSPGDYVVPPHKQLLIPTQIKLQIPLGYYGRIAPKSGLAILHQLHVGAGVIAPDYTGEIMVLMINAASRAYSIKRNDPIAQLILLEKVSIPILKQINEIPPTVRGTHGCGF